MSGRRSLYLVPWLAGLQAFAPLTIGVYLPALPAITRSLSTDAASVQLTVSIFLFGLFIGMLLYGPLSDRYGRRPLLLAGIAVYIVASFGCLSAGSIHSLLGWRFVQALGAASASVLGRVIVRDLFPLKQSARVLSLMHLVTMVATLLMPLLASYLLLWVSWRWLFSGLMVFALIWWLAVLRLIPETLHRRADDVGLLRLFSAYRRILSHPRSLGYVLCMALCFAGMFAYLTLSAFVFIEYFGLTPR
ncbi:arabinose efflux permease [Gynuella sunshinyii YC6258]|uniref:Bcr/CflA family efflux transporter n=1 Tax=Gynuella sunshinyii YC6258 TaxID=1445510 RepID=A0A0C5VWI9_9GAMM|nr:arabinose efflux permease [Gynuella sunshinyii YC6258]